MGARLFTRACRLLRCVAHSSEAILRILCSISGPTFGAVSWPKFLIGAAPRTIARKMMIKLLSQLASARGLGARTCRAQLPFAQAPLGMSLARNAAA